MLTRVSEATGAVIIVIHHARKPQRDGTGGAKMAIRGSGAIFDACGSVLVFEAEKGEAVRVSHEKARASGRLADDFVLRIEDEEIDGVPRAGLVVTAEGAAPKRGGKNAVPDNELERRILDTLKRFGSQSSKRALVDRTEGADGPLYAALKRLVTAGQVTLEDGHYSCAAIAAVAEEEAQQ